MATRPGPFCSGHEGWPMCAGVFQRVSRQERPAQRVRLDRGHAQRDDTALCQGRGRRRYVSSFYFLRTARACSPTPALPRRTPARTVSVLPPYPRTVSVLPPYPRPTPAVLPSSRCFAVFSMCVQASRRPTTTTASRSTARLLRRSAYSLAARARHGGPALPLTDRAPARWPRHAHRRRKRTVCAAQPHTPS